MNNLALFIHFYLFTSLQYCVCKKGLQIKEFPIEQTRDLMTCQCLLQLQYRDEENNNH